MRSVVALAFGATTLLSALAPVAEASHLPDPTNGQVSSQRAKAAILEQQIARENAQQAVAGEQLDQAGVRLQAAQLQLTTLRRELVGQRRRVAAGRVAVR
ncbi:MAG: hypothetical protein JWM85_247, partial [Acidimicrobiaceae bacterium]|nr:hypothetical protein [Acidimicrobiaceae bacterium]